MEYSGCRGNRVIGHRFERRQDLVGGKELN